MLEFLVWESQIRRQEMPRKRYTPEQIIQHLREAEVLLAQGKTIAQVCKKIGITDQTYYRWRKEYGGIRTDQAKRLKDLAKFNTDFGDRFWGHIVPGVPPTPGGSGPISGRRTGQCPLLVDR
jgi:putative transposase